METLKWYIQCMLFLCTISRILDRLEFNFHNSALEKLSPLNSQKMSEMISKESNAKKNGKISKLYDQIIVDAFKIFFLQIGFFFS